MSEEREAPPLSRRSKAAQRDALAFQAAITRAAGYLHKLAATEVERDALKEALRDARDGLNAGIRQYASRDIHGNEVPGDEQFPWVRAMQIGRDAAVRALAASAS